MCAQSGCDDATTIDTLIAIGVAVRAPQLYQTVG
jgi:hypothetical protein